MFQSEPMQRCTLGICKAACCLHGVWVDSLEVREILQNASLIQPHLPENRRDPAGWFDAVEELDEHTPSGKVQHTHVLDNRRHYRGTACIFLRSDSKCALQVAAESAGLHPWRLKPFYCILHPLDLDDEGRITIDDTALLVEELASCLVLAQQPIPLAVTFEPELRYLLGEKTYSALFNKK